MDIAGYYNTGHGFCIVFLLCCCIIQQRLAPTNKIPIGLLLYQPASLSFPQNIGSALSRCFTHGTCIQCLIQVKVVFLLVLSGLDSHAVFSPIVSNDWLNLLPTLDCTLPRAYTKLHVYVIVVYSMLTQKWYLICDLDSNCVQFSQAVNNNHSTWSCRHCVTFKD